MSCSTANSVFLRRIVPISRLGAAPVASKFVDNESMTPILYGSDEWRDTMCNLYRQLLKLHDVFFPVDDPRRDFGDRFLATEFRRAKDLNEKMAVKFYAAWIDYGTQLERGAAARGRSLTEAEETKLNPEQKESLQRLRTEAFRRVLEDPGRDPTVPGGAKNH